MGSHSPASSEDPLFSLCCLSLSCRLRPKCREICTPPSNESFWRQVRAALPLSVLNDMNSDSIVMGDVMVARMGIFSSKSSCYSFDPSICWWYGPFFLDYLRCSCGWVLCMILILSCPKITSPIFNCMILLVMFSGIVASSWTNISSLVTLFFMITIVF